MKEYNPVSLDLGSIKTLVIENLNVISTSIKTVVTQVRSNDKKTTQAIEDASIQAWTTTNRPTSTNNLNVIGINTTTGNLNYTTDGGATWKNYDGTAA
jgi:hypothetical protein